MKKNPTLMDIQRYIQEMEEKRHFTNVTLLQTYLLLVEEVGELAKSIRKSHTNMRTDASKQYEENAAHEVADVFMLMTAVANRLGVDIESALREKEEHNNQRVWE